MRSQHRRALPHPRPVRHGGEIVQPVGVEHHRQRLGEDEAHQVLLDAAGVHARPDGQHVAGLGGLAHLANGAGGEAAASVTLQRHRRGAWAQRGDGLLHRLRRGEGNQPRPAAQCGVCGQRNRADHTARPADDEHPAVVALVPVALAAGKTGQ